MSFGHNADHDTHNCNPAADIINGDKAITSLNLWVFIPVETVIIYIKITNKNIFTHSPASRLCDILMKKFTFARKEDCYEREEAKYWDYPKKIR